MGKKNCWEFMGCGREFSRAARDGREACPTSLEVMLDGVHGGRCAGRACWTVAGTMCKGRPMGSYADKLSDCRKCAFYKSVMADEAGSFMEASEMVRHAESGVPVMRARPGGPSDDAAPLDGKGDDIARDSLESSFDAELKNALRRAYEACGYRESRLLHMVRELGPLKAVKRVLRRQQFLYGVSELGRCGCLNLSAERLVLDYRYAVLFSEEERLAALTRLKSAGGSGGLGKVLLGRRPEDAHPVC